MISDEGVETVDAKWSKGTGDIESNLGVCVCVCVEREVDARE